MKISKIVCVALLNVVFSSTALAGLVDTIQSYNQIRKQKDAMDKAYVYSKTNINTDHTNITKFFNSLVGKDISTLKQKGLSLGGGGMGINKGAIEFRVQESNDGNSIQSISIYMVKNAKDIDEAFEIIRNFMQTGNIQKPDNAIFEKLTFSANSTPGQDQIDRIFKNISKDDASEFIEDIYNNTSVEKILLNHHYNEIVRTYKSELKATLKEGKSLDDDMKMFLAREFMANIGDEELENLSIEEAEKYLKKEFLNAKTKIDKDYFADEIEEFLSQSSKQHPELRKLLREYKKSIPKPSELETTNIGIEQIPNLPDSIKAMMYDQVAKNELIKQIKSSLEEIPGATSVTFVSNIIKISNDLSTSTRLAKLSNPYNENLALAYAIKNLTGEAFASSDDGALGSVIKSYTDRFNYDNNLWANMIGAKGNLKNSANPKLYGFSIGYDKAFDEAIFGGYMTLGRSKAQNSLINYNAKNYELGIYARKYFNNNEIDMKFSYGLVKNALDRTIMGFKNSSKYNTKIFNFDAAYGYIFKIQENLFIKPLLGLTHTSIKNEGFTETGALAMSFDKTNKSIISAKFGAEMRAYLQNGNYFYITPTFQRDLYKSKKNAMVRFAQTNHDIIINSDNKKYSYAVLNAGFELKLNKNFSTNLNLGTKLKKDEKYYTGSLGLKYRF